ncbi:response regulator [Saccharothrix algeriensis]|uniref:DNA-binding NarL/FixJ family response regulator n=1 Tax=Saccharothrix algeriensis TaxID=173560 RepID=A0A8T8I1C1_9PSEU|nr:response regulator transcription factor [Saccharothrix algeriensis]MBM7810488.1 DNA-binding NarL/FixJ family response regulator [Saccharothrix algeriensis]QTR04612.1 response regulator transcription factor [Saccharothrix algeriensis]
MIRVLIADDQHMVRAGFRMILAQEPDIEVVGDVPDGAAAVSAARALRPDVCLVDIRMPGLDGFAVTRELAGPDVPDPIGVVVVTTFDFDEYVMDALTVGALGFLLKDAEPALLVAAVRAAARGDALVSPEVTLRLIRNLRESGRTPPRPPVELSDRELDVVRAVSRGRTNPEIAHELYLSRSTVKTHLASVQGKIGARNRVEIAIWAWQHGLMD